MRNRVTSQTRDDGGVRPLLRCLLATCLALLLVACGGGDPAATGADTAPDETTPGREGDSTSKPPRSSAPGSGQPVEDPAPEFEVQTFDGQSFSLAEQRGTPVVLNFWESW
jgi:hypothetical protein